MKTKQTKAGADAADEKKSNRGRKPAGRAKGAGTLQKHGRFYRAVWTVDGVTYRRSTGTAVKADAEMRLAEFVAPFQLKTDAANDAKTAKAAKRAGKAVAAAALAETAETRRKAAGRMLIPLSGAWEAFNPSPLRRSVSPGVNRIYESRWGVFLAWMEKNRPAVRGLADVDADTAAAFMRDIRAKSSPKTYNDYRALLSQVWRILDTPAGLDGFNPWRETKKLDGEDFEEHERRELTVDELVRLTQLLEGEWRVLFALGIYTGLRMGDCLALTWEKVNLDRPIPCGKMTLRGFIQCVPRKTRKHKTVVRIPLFPSLREILAETPRSRRHGKILPGLAEDYARCTPPFCRRVKRLFEAAGIETQGETGRINPKTGTARKAVKVGFHSLRHTFISLCENAGVPQSTVQAIVGHTNAAMTEHYFHVSDEALGSAVAALPDVFQGARSVAALPAPAEAVEAEEVEGVPVDKAREAVEAFKRACEGLKGAGLTKDDWREVSAALAAVENARRA